MNRWYVARVPLRSAVVEILRSVLDLFLGPPAFAVRRAAAPPPIAAQKLRELNTDRPAAALEVDEEVGRLVSEDRSLGEGTIAVLYLLQEQDLPFLIPAPVPLELAPEPEGVVEDPPVPAEWLGAFWRVGSGGSGAA